MRALFFITVLFLFACNTPTQQAPAAAANITAVASTKQVFTCGATTKSGNPCQRKVSERGAKCYQHDTPATAANITAVASTKQAPATASVQQCEGMTKKGERCKNKQKAVFCHLHSK